MLKQLERLQVDQGGEVAFLRWLVDTMAYGGDRVYWRQVHAGLQVWQQGRTTEPWQRHYERLVRSAVEQQEAAGLPPSTVLTRLSRNGDGK